MLTPKISASDLKANLSKLAIPASELKTLKALLAKGGDPLKKYLLELEKKQAGFLTNQLAKGAIGWANLANKDKSVLVIAGKGFPVISISGKPIFNPTYVIHPSQDFPEDAFIEELKRSEGDISWLYLDTEGNVTIGIGQLVRNAAALIALHKGALPMKVLAEVSKEKPPADDSTEKRPADESTEKPPADDSKEKPPADEPTEKPPADASKEIKTITDELLTESYNAVKAATKGKLASAYKDLTSIRLKDKSDAVKQAKKKMYEAHTQLKNSRYTFHFLSFPSPVQHALVDIVYNIGITNFKAFTELHQAVNHRDWDRAANEVSRKGIAADRNQRTKDLVSGLINSKSIFVNTTNKKIGKSVVWGCTGFKDRNISQLLPDV